MNREQEKAMFANNYNAHVLTKSFFDKQQSKANYLHGKAESQRELSEKLHEYNHKIAGVMNGTPLLVDHYSYNRHKNELDRMHKREGKAYEASDYADKLDKRAENKINSYAVSASDPDAVVKLKNRINDFEREKAERQEKLKTAPEGSNFTDGTKANHRMYIASLTTNIRNTKKRLEILDKHSKIEEKEEKSGNGVSYKIDQTDNRIRLFFPDKPSEEIRTKLKSRGWRWSPFNNAWQKQISEQAIYQAKEYLE